jgi:hypothetical protein
MQKQKKNYQGITAFKKKLYMTRGDQLVEATQEEIDAFLAKRNARKAKQTQQNEKLELEEKRVKNAPYAASDTIRRTIPFLKKCCKKDCKLTYEEFKQKDFVGTILNETQKFANDLWSKSGFFANRKDNFTPSISLQYAYHSYNIDALGTEKKIPKFLQNFDSAWNGKEAMEDMAKFRATSVFMKILWADMQAAILKTALYKIEMKEQGELAKAIADRAHVTDTRDPVQNAKAAAMKIMNATETIHMKDKGVATDLIIEEICSMLMESNGPAVLSKKGFLMYCTQKGGSVAPLQEFFIDHEDTFVGIMKRGEGAGQESQEEGHG